MKALVFAIVFLGACGGSGTEADSTELAATQENSVCSESNVLFVSENLDMYNALKNGLKEGTKPHYFLVENSLHLESKLYELMNKCDSWDAFVFQLGAYESQAIPAPVKTPVYIPRESPHPVVQDLRRVADELAKNKIASIFVTLPEEGQRFAGDFNVVLKNEFKTNVYHNGVTSGTLADFVNLFLED